MSDMAKVWTKNARELREMAETVENTPILHPEIPVNYNSCMAEADDLYFRAALCDEARNNVLAERRKLALATRVKL